MNRPDTDNDPTVVQPGTPKSRPDNLPYFAVADAPSGARQKSDLYIAQQTSFDDYTSGINPLVNAATSLLLENIKIKNGHIEDIKGLRNRLEAEVRSFTNQAQTAGLKESECTAASYLLCTALDECVTSSAIPDATAKWSAKSLLSTFHKETHGGEVFFDVLDRTVQQPAAHLYLLELIFLILSFGFEGKYRLQDRGPLSLESKRDSLFKQIRLIRGEPSPDLSKKIDHRTFKNKTYAYVPMWLTASVVVVCLAVTFWGFSFTLNKKAESILAKYATHAPHSAPYVEPARPETQPEEVHSATPEDTGANSTTASEASR